MTAINLYKNLNDLLQKLELEKDVNSRLDIGIEIANEVMNIIMPNDGRGNAWRSTLRKGEDVLDSVIPAGILPNSKVESWFEKHPYLGGERTALKHFFIEDVPFESKFYWLNRSANKARISAGVALTPNWEDSNLTKYPDYKVGIDFFLTADASALLVVVSNQGNLRVLELSGRLSNTQIEVLNKIDGAGGFDGIGDLEPQQTIHKTLWEAFALRELNKKFYDGISPHFQQLLQHLVSSGDDKKKEQDAKLFANRLIGRLLFIWFLRKKGFINEGIGYFDSANMKADEYYTQKLKPLFFMTLNTPIRERAEVMKDAQWRSTMGKNAQFKVDSKTPYLNGGLFDPHPNDWVEEEISFPKSWFDTLYTHFDQFNFTTDESTPEYEQVAIDPEMLGRVFENLLASQLTETGEEARKASGTFYTPREIVSYMCKETLRQYLYTTLENESFRNGIDILLDANDNEVEIKHSDFKKSLWGKEQASIVAPKIQEALNRFAVLDPACGSGAFPMGMLQLLLKTKNRLDGTPNPYKTKLAILSENIFGIDIEPMAVEISRLRAWLSLVVDEKDASSVEPLPNLDFRFVCANSLVPLNKGEDTIGQRSIFVETEKEDKLRELRRKYFHETIPANKERIQKDYDSILIDFHEKSPSERNKQIQRWSPFDLMKPADFFDPDEMFGIDSGFDAVIGNPPYIHLEKMKEQSKKLYRPLGYQSYEARGDIYSLFYERGIQLLKKRGVLTYITSNKWMRAAYGKSLREFFGSQTNPAQLIDFSGQKIFDATVDTNILVLRNEQNTHRTQATIIKEDCTNNLSDYIKRNSTTSVFDSSESWTILNDIEQRIKEKIEAVGVPLRDWDIKINRGILTGCNEAFIIDGVTKDRLIAEDPKSAEIIRPILRGRDIKRYSYTFADKWVIATFPSCHYNIENYPVIRDYLIEAEWRHGLTDKDKFKGMENGYGKLRLEQSGEEHIVDDIKFKARKKTRNKWFESQDPIGYWDEFSRQEKIVWAELARTGNAFALDDSKSAVLNTCYILTSNNPNINLKYLLALLNSKMILFYMNIVSSKLDETGWRWLKQFIDAIPLVKSSAKNHDIKNLVSEVLRSKKNGKDVINKEKAIDKIVYSLYKLDAEEAEYIEKYKFISQ